MVRIRVFKQILRKVLGGNMNLKREDLEKLALETVSAELYYDLADAVGDCADSDLYKIIECGGDYKKELAWQDKMEGVK
jgi:hypothetical protein